MEHSLEVIDNTKDGSWDSGMDLKGLEWVQFPSSSDDGSESLSRIDKKGRIFTKTLQQMSTHMTGNYKCVFLRGPGPEDTPQVKIAEAMLSTFGDMNGLDDSKMVICMDDNPDNVSVDNYMYDGPLLCVKTKEAFLNPGQQITTAYLQHHFLGNKLDINYVVSSTGKVYSRYFGTTIKVNDIGSIKFTTTTLSLAEIVMESLGGSIVVPGKYVRCKVDNDYSLDNLVFLDGVEALQAFTIEKLTNGHPGIKFFPAQYPGYANRLKHYIVSDSCRVYSLHWNKFMKLPSRRFYEVGDQDVPSYKHVTLKLDPEDDDDSDEYIDNDGGYRRTRITALHHALILSSVVNHINHNVHDCSLQNLELVTSAENTQF
ncbi:unnamed protein product [Absidia cylindrospora]